MSASNLTCRLMGHRYRFSADGRLMRWSCQRGCGAGGTKEYETAADARRFAVALDREDLDQLGRRPTLSLIPLWVIRKLRNGPGRAS